MTLRQRWQSVWTTRQSRRLFLLAIVAVCLVLTFPAAEISSQLYEANWDSIREAGTAAALQEAAVTFSTVQRGARRAAVELAQRTEVRTVLADGRNGMTELFRIVKRASEAGDAGVEVYDRAGRLVAWEGPGGPPHRREIRIALDGQMSSNVDRTPLASQLFVVTPVREQGIVVGVVLYRVPINFQAPVRNAIFAQEGLSEELSRDLAVDVRFSFQGRGNERLPEGYRKRLLFGIDSAWIGTVAVAPPDRSGALESMLSVFSVARAVLILLLLTFGALTVWQRVRKSASPATAVAAAVLLVWAARYLLLLSGIPSFFFRSGIFDPALFASPFGGGLARSIGEMGLTMAALAVTIGYATVRFAPPLAGWVRSGGARGRLRGWVAAVVVTALLFWLFRGYAAVIRSAVFDSTLPYGDLRPLVPSFELAVMMVNVIVLSLGMVTVAGLVGLAVVGLCAGGRPERSGWGGAVLLIFLATLLYGLAFRDPLVGWIPRVLFSASALAGAAMLGREFAPAGSWQTRTPLFAAVVLSSVILVPVLNEMVQARERRRVETFAREVLRPVEPWLSFVARETLDSFDSPDVREILTGAGTIDPRQLAFAVWSRSVACREGYPVLLVVTDAQKQEISRFSIGGQSDAVGPLDADLRLADTMVQVVRQAGGGVNAVRLYGGARPITDSSGAVEGFARVILTAGQQSLFRGEASSILRASPGDGAESFRGRVVLSEFRDRILFSSTSDRFPVGYALPPVAQPLLRDLPSGSAWGEHVVDGRTYASLFVRKDDRTVVALSLIDLGPVRVLVGAEQMLGYYLATVLLGGALWLVVRILRRKRLVFAFRDRLLAALLLTAAVPLVLISLYGRYDAGEQLWQETERLLGDQTAAVSASLLGAPGGGVEALLGVTPPVVEAIATELDLDFNVYADSLLVITSRPELYDLGILERRMPGTVYAAMLLGGRRFHVETERIGTLHYAVGYRLMLDEAGRIAGTVAVPTAYQRDDFDEAVTSRNAFLLGVYVLVLGFLVLVAMLLANRIAAPIQRLTDATRRVARGDFDVTVRTSASEATGGGDEIDQLVTSFEAMTRDLKKSREELIHYERELAWKEMAKQVAHEIKNPLTPMRLAVQHLRQTYRDRVAEFDSVLERVTGTILGQIDTLSRIASEFSHFARMPRRRIERFDLNAVLRESVSLCRQEGSTEFVFLLDPSQPALEGDREEIGRAFVNVLKNGMQAMGGAGRMQIVTLADAETATVLVRDEGPGIPPDVRARLFEPNFSTKTEGMGLGLAIVKKTVDDMGGTIVVGSETGKGTTVRMTFPRAGESA